MFLRLSQNGDETPPPCPVLYDEVLEIPVVPACGRSAGDLPQPAGVRRHSCAADWLADLVDEDDACAPEEDG